MGLQGIMRLEQTAFTHLLSHSFSSPRSHQGEPMPARYCVPQNARIGFIHAQAMLRCFHASMARMGIVLFHGTSEPRVSNFVPCLQVWAKLGKACFAVHLTSASLGKSAATSGRICGFSLAYPFAVSPAAA